MHMPHLLPPALRCTGQGQAAACTSTSQTPISWEGGQTYISVVECQGAEARLLFSQYEPSLPHTVDLAVRMVTPFFNGHGDEPGLDSHLYGVRGRADPGTMHTTGKQCDAVNALPSSYPVTSSDVFGKTFGERGVYPSTSMQGWTVSVSSVECGGSLASGYATRADRLDVFNTMLGLFERAWGQEERRSTLVLDAEPYKALMVSFGGTGEEEQTLRVAALMLLLDHG